MTTATPSVCGLALVMLVASAPLASGQSFRVSFDEGLKADRSAGRADPWVSKGVERVPGKFGMAVRTPTPLVYAGEENVLAGRGTVACWCKIPRRPGPLDIQRLIYVQCKERGYWNYLAALEWQESVFRAMVFDFYHGHGWHDPDALPAFTADTWHHVALVWDQAYGAKFFLDGKLVGSTWAQQAWWERPTPHAIHLGYPGADYDELCIYRQPLSDAEVMALAKDNKWEVADQSAARDEAAIQRLTASLQGIGLDKLPTVDLKAQRPGDETVIKQVVVRSILDDRIPSWKVMDGRMDLFWPEWRSPTLGDVDFSGSEITIALAPDQHPSHLLLRGSVGGCQVHGERNGYVSRAPLASVPAGLHFLAVEKTSPDLTGLQLPRREGMKLQEIGWFAVESKPRQLQPSAVTPISGELKLETLDNLASQIRMRCLPEERRILGQAATAPIKSTTIPRLTRVHFITEPVAEVTPLDALSLRLTFMAPWQEDIWWLRVQDPVNPRRDLIHVPIRVINPNPGKEATLALRLDFWDIMLDAQARLWVELLPTQSFTLLPGSAEPSSIALLAGDKQKVLAEFAHTQSQLAFSYWQLGSEAGGQQGWDPRNPSFNLLGGITQNHELWLTMEWVRRHVPDQRLINGLWQITHGKRSPAPVKPRLQPANAPEWAVWGRELLERFRGMAHDWADWQGPDGQLGGGWNDDTDFPGVFICLPLLGDTRTQQMFTRVFDGLEQTGYLHNSVSRAPIDTLHATDFLSWRAHLILFDYGQPRHIERALALTRELDKWTKADAKGHRRAVTNHYSEDGPERRPGSKVNDDGSIEQLREFQDGSIAQFLRDSLFCAWYSGNPRVLQFVREAAEGDYARAVDGTAAASYAFYTYATLFNDNKYIDEPVDRFLRDRWATPIWRRFAERLPNGKRVDAQFLKLAQSPAASEETLTAAYLASKEKAYLVRALRGACENLEGGWQFRGGEARGANDHFYVQGQAALSQLYLGSALTWLRPASIVPPIAVSWQGIDANVAAIVLEASPQSLRLAAYNFDDQPRKVRMRLWELAPGKYELHTGIDEDQDDRIDGKPSVRELAVQRGTPVELQLPSHKIQVVELKQLQVLPRPAQLADLAVGDGDIAYDKATDRLKVTVHNIGAAPAKDVTVRFEDPDGKLVFRQTIRWLDAPLDLQAKTAVVWMPQPTLHPVARIVVRIDPDNRLEEITKENNQIVWER